MVNNDTKQAGSVILRVKETAERGRCMSLENEITGADHLGILTGDLKRDVAWYEEKLGFEKLQQRIVVMNGRTEIALLRKGNLVLELVEPAGRLKEEAKLRGAGKWDHFAMEAPELEKEAALAEEKGLKVHPSTPDGLTWYEHLGEKGVRGINFYGPGGEVLEFCREEAVDYHGKTGLPGWSHLALKVENLERTEAFYGKMGFQVRSKGYLPTPEGDIRIHYLEKCGFVMEVLEMTGSGLEELKQRKEGRLDHIALRVKDIREAFDGARKNGYPLLNHTIQELPLLEKGIRFFFVSGPDGEKVEFVEKI